MGLLIRVVEGGLYVDSDAVKAIERDGDTVFIDAHDDDSGDPYIADFDSEEQAEAEVERIANDVNMVRVGYPVIDEPAYDDEGDGEEGGEEQ